MSPQERAEAKRVRRAARGEGFSPYADQNVTSAAKESREAWTSTGSSSTGAMLRQLAELYYGAPQA